VCKREKKGKKGGTRSNPIKGRVKKRGEKKERGEDWPAPLHLSLPSVAIRRREEKKREKGKGMIRSPLTSSRDMERKTAFGHLVRRSRSCVGRG